MNTILNIVRSIYGGGSNKAVVVAAGALLNAAESGNWTSVQSTVGYVLTILTWLIPNVGKAVEVPPKS